MRDTAGRSDEELDGLIRQTMLFQTLSAVWEAKRQDLVLSPEDTLVIPTLSDVSREHTELTTQNVLDLHQAYERERDMLYHHIHSLALSEWYGRALRLVTVNMASA